MDRTGKQAPGTAAGRRVCTHQGQHTLGNWREMTWPPSCNYDILSEIQLYQLILEEQYYQISPRFHLTTEPQEYLKRSPKNKNNIKMRSVADAKKNCWELLEKDLLHAGCCPVTQINSFKTKNIRTSPLPSSSSAYLYWSITNCFTQKN